MEEWELPEDLKSRWNVLQANGWTYSGSPAGSDGWAGYCVTFCAPRAVSSQGNLSHTATRSTWEAAFRACLDIAGA